MASETRLTVDAHKCIFYSPAGSNRMFLYLFQDVEEDEFVSENEEETCLYPSPAKKKLFSVYIRPHQGNLSDYPYCITPQQTVKDFHHILLFNRLNSSTTSYD